MRLDIGAALFITNNFSGKRRVIDISGDGANNSGDLVDVARDRALARGHHHQRPAHPQSARRAVGVAAGRGAKFVLPRLRHRRAGRVPYRCPELQGFLPRHIAQAYPRNRRRAARDRATPGSSAIQTIARAGGPSPSDPGGRETQGATVLNRRTALAPAAQLRRRRLDAEISAAIALVIRYGPSSHSSLPGLTR